MRPPLPTPCFALTALALAAAAQEPDLGELRSVRAWSGPESTRVVVELSRETRWKYGRLSRPERLFFDFLETRPRLGPQRVHTVPVGDPRLQRVRTGLKDAQTTRLVLDLAAEVEYEVSRLTNPERLVIELRLKSAAGRSTSLSQAAPPAGPAPVPRSAEARSPAQPAAHSPEVAASAPPARPAAAAQSRADSPPTASPAAPPAPAAAVDAPRPVESKQPQAAGVPRPAVSAPASAAESAAAGPAARSEAAAPAAPQPLPARPTRRGEQSLTRALGLHIGRVAIDPGHGGHDQGTQGPTGLLEKELVLDVALRLGSLIAERLGGEVVYTRRTDDFIPLEERTAIANESRADLFLSIHANSSPVRRVSGAEVFYLNFTTSREALDLAARENAGHNRSIFELRELIQKIALKDKLDESREFAGYVQQELSREWRRLNPAARDRGAKTAPFVVLIGASMPSVLAEIGFLSNPKDEALMKKPEYRQRLAEALYRGVERYARSLGQTQALRAATAAESPQSTR